MPDLYAANAEVVKVCSIVERQMEACRAGLLAEGVERLPWEGGWELLLAED
jgi:hypothetical protein